MYGTSAAQLQVRQLQVRQLQVQLQVRQLQVRQLQVQLQVRQLQVRQLQVRQLQVRQLQVRLYVCYACIHVNTGTAVCMYVCMQDHVLVVCTFVMYACMWEELKQEGKEGLGGKGHAAYSQTEEQGKTHQVRLLQGLTEQLLQVRLDVCMYMCIYVCIYASASAAVAVSMCGMCESKSMCC
jgi:hypothetical protein